MYSWRLERWLDFLAEYEIEILHRAGASDDAFYYLSRTVVACSSNSPEHGEGDLVAALHSVTVQENSTFATFLLEVACHLQV